MVVPPMNGEEKNLEFFQLNSPPSPVSDNDIVAGTQKSKSVSGASQISTKKLLLFHPGLIQKYLSGTVDF